MENYSVEHTCFLKKKKRERHCVLFFQIFLFLSFFGLWEILVHFHVLNSFLYSSPSKILETLFHLLLHEDLLLHIGITLLEIFISFFLSLFLGVLFSILLWRFSLFSKVMDPFLTILNSLPKVALGPLIIIWCGANTGSIIFMSLLISLFVTILTIYNGFLQVDPNLLTMARSFGASKWQEFRYVVFPSNYQTILSTLKVNLSMNFIGVIMGELLVSKKGLGYLIMYGSQVFHLDLVISCIFLLGMISYILYLLIQKIK